MTGTGLRSWDPRWKRRYNSPPDDLIREFYVPAFARSVSYDRAVGFFSSHLLATVAPALDEFVLNGGTMRLITSPANLSPEDLEAMGKGGELRRELRADLDRALRLPVPQAVLKDRLKLLTWMVATGRLEVQIALREHREYYTLFHEKIGVFTDCEDNWMTFTGSPNETVGGAQRYSESFPLHRSWANPEQMAFAAEERERFASIWDAEVQGIATWRVNEWMEEPMRAQFGIREPTSSPRMSYPKSREAPADRDDSQLSLLPMLPDGLILREYQRQAVNDWLEAGGTGTFAMATGTGKTITALAAATQVAHHCAQRQRPVLILVIVPSIDLVEQWCGTAEWFGFRPSTCHSRISGPEQRRLKAAFSAARLSRGQRAEMVITTAGSLASFSKERGQARRDHFLQRQLARHNGPLMVIGDEVHSLGTQRRLSALPANPQFTLGLSATPKRHGDDEGTAALLKYFGRPIISISIKQAIYEYKALVPYDYFVWPIELTEDEIREYRVISSRIAAAYATGDEERAEPLIRRRTRLIQHAKNKIHQLRQLMGDGLKDETHQIIYIAEGKNPETDLRQLDEAEGILRDEFNMRIQRYVGETDAQRREVLQERLIQGEIQALLAMRCLDEGVDLPAARIGTITASTRNPRQFVQRRGRLLRRDPHRPKSHATIHDFLVMPPRPDGSLLSSESRLIGAELSRAAELADAARNREVLFRIAEWGLSYGLNPQEHPWMDLSGDDEWEEWYHECI